MSTPAPRVTADDALEREPSAAHQAVTLNSGHRIARARRIEPARGREQRRDESLVQPDRPSRNPGKWAPHRPHRSVSIAATRAASISSGRASRVRARATSATSHPAQGPPTRPTAARITRLLRFRTTAEPSFLPATKSTRPFGSRASGVSTANTSRVEPAARPPSANSRSTSACAVIVRMAPPMSGAESHYDAALGHRTVRPLRRRAARIARPAFVDIRFRKPCVLARFRLFGWYVRFTVILLSVHRRKAGHKPGDYSGGSAGVSTRESAAGTSRSMSSPEGRHNDREKSLKSVDTVENAGLVRVSPVDNRVRLIVSGHAGLLESAPVRERCVLGPFLDNLLLRGCFFCLAPGAAAVGGYVVHSCWASGQPTFRRLSIPVHRDRHIPTG